MDTLVDTADQGGEQMDAGHRRSGAKQILRGCCHAAAHHDTKPGDLSLVHRWVATQDLKEPLSLLARKTPAATM